jgi:hypothetical protein
MKMLSVALCVGVMAMAAAQVAGADTSSSNRAVSASGVPAQPKCPKGESYKKVCVKTVATPRPKGFPKNEPWLGEKCVKYVWKCVAPVVIK